ncbi:MAG: protein phosphatase 2C domain-containing protein [Acidobacteriota bacterium]|nr:protein phosphatase 2C domain-containing protein [Acidobacteriota bacterium]
MIEGRDFAAATTIGARCRQEDDWGVHVQPPALEKGALLLAGVADGMGGMPAGDRASDVAIRTFFDSYSLISQPARGRLRRALAHANREVGIVVEAEPDLAGMGCTLVVVLFFNDRAEWLSIGDSLILRWRADGLKRINPLHTYGNELDVQVKRGEISADSAREHPDRAALTSAIQGTVLEEVAQGELDVALGDIVILASDGLASLDDQEIESICAARVDGEEPAARIATTLIGRIEARARPGQDNATVVVVRIGGDKLGPVDSRMAEHASRRKSSEGEAADRQGRASGFGKRVESRRLVSEEDPSGSTA